MESQTICDPLSVEPSNDLVDESNVIFVVIDSLTSESIGYVFSKELAEEYIRKYIQIKKTDLVAAGYECGLVDEPNKYSLVKVTPRWFRYPYTETVECLTIQKIKKITYSDVYDTC